MWTVVCGGLPNLCRQETSRDQMTISPGAGASVARRTVPTTVGKLLYGESDVCFESIARLVTRLSHLHKPRPPPPPLKPLSPSNQQPHLSFPFHLLYNHPSINRQCSASPALPSTSLYVGEMCGRGFYRPGRPDASLTPPEGSPCPARPRQRHRYRSPWPGAPGPRDRQRQEIRYVSLDAVTSYVSGD